MSIEVEKLAVVGWMPAILGMRNPMDSWSRMDSTSIPSYKPTGLTPGPMVDEVLFLGVNDAKLMLNLLRPGTSDHCKFRRQITVYLNVTAPLYWWKEADTYKVGTVANSCSTMHTITKSPFEPDMFAHDHLGAEGRHILDQTIEFLNRMRGDYLSETVADRKKAIWYNIIQSLPSSWLQMRTLSLNYEVLANMTAARRYHKLDEWRCFVEWVCGNLPYPWIFDRNSRDPVLGKTDEELREELKKEYMRLVGRSGGIEPFDFREAQ